MEHLRTHNIEENSTRETCAINQQALIQNAMDIAQENPQKKHRLNESQGKSMDLVLHPSNKWQEIENS